MEGSGNNQSQDKPAGPPGPLAMLVISKKQEEAPPDPDERLHAVAAQAMAAAKRDDAKAFTSALKAFVAMYTRKG